MAAIIRFDIDVLEMTMQDGCCTTVEVQNEIPNHQQLELSENLTIPPL